ncbi:MAG TPA: AraC family transcriptional regulator, partial [Candidatus Eisenbacteria bacterium]|nr:AraC family transcriptional regulator [Candidatus Eisenbacteria bacterium]
MPTMLGRVDPRRLERFCGRRDSIRFGPPAPGIERAEVHLSTRGYEPHRHDTYAIGVSTAGVLRFRYRGSRCVCLPGQLHVLHPDERHDGTPGTDDGIGYRTLYVAPEMVRAALGSRPLPFVAEPVQEPTPRARSIASLLADIAEPISDLRRIEIATAVADGLAALAGGAEPRRHPIDLRAVDLVREHLATHAREQTPVAVLERIAGTDRFTIARHFRLAFGTSPDRYRTLRRLELARGAIACGRSLAETAAETGFADQSHMTRQFKRTYGVTPARWQALTAAARSP